jgi:iron complex outermembrane receptor protein
MTSTNSQDTQLTTILPQRKIMAHAVRAAVMASVIASPVAAQSLEEVIVTATKRKESIQDVPLAITALSGDFVNKVNLDDVKDLVSYTPGVTGNSQDSFIDAISVRGIRTQDFGVGGDPSAAFFKNDLYEGRNGSAVTSLYDIERAEVLRGPQGFLFGRNSIGGAFSVHTKKADPSAGLSGFVQADVAERDHIALDGGLNIPVSDNFAMRMAGYYSQEDGFAKNYYNGDDLIEHQKWALRWSTSYERDKLAVYTTVEYEDREQSGSAYRAVQEGDIWDTWQAALGPLELRGGDEDIDSDQSNGDADNATITTLGLRVEYDFDFATLTSITGYKDHDYFYTEDYDGTPRYVNNYQQDQNGNYFQQELRLTSNSDGPLDWYAGASFYREEIDTDFLFAGEEDYFCQYYGYYYNSGQTFSGCADLYAYYGSEWTPSADGTLTETGNIDGTYEGWAAYVNLDYAVTDTIDIGIGVRYTDDEKDFAIDAPTPQSELGPYWAYGFSTAEPIQDKKSWDDVQTRIQLRFTPNDDNMFFASYTEGFKSGGFGSFNLANNSAGEPAIGNTDIVQSDGFLPNAFDPETVDSYEIGYKGSLLDGGANFDITAFYYEYEDLQVVTFDGGASIVKNVGSVESSGIEASLTSSLGEYFTLYLSLGYLDSEAKDLQDICGLEDPNGCEGRELFWAPEWSGAAVLDFAYALSGGEIRASYEVFGESERGGGWENLSETKIDSYTEMAFRVGFHSDDNWFVDAYVENLTDEFTWDGQNNNGGMVPSHFFGPKRPRTYGVKLGASFD